MDPAETILFASPDLLVRRIAAGSGDRCVVTFDSYTDVHTLDRPGFGESFFRNRGVDAIHVVSLENRWYQHDALDDVLAAIAAATAGYATVIAYGSSMGGYAALVYGAACGATIGVALSPQYSIDPAVCGFDKRWAHDAERIRFRNDATEPLPIQYVFYDPRDRHDARHAALFATRSPTIAVALPYGGHPVGSFINETVGLGEIFDRIAAADLDGQAFAEAVRAGRRRSGQYLFTLAARVPAWRPAQKVALARMASATAPDEPAYRSFLGQALDAAGRHGEALPEHLFAIETSTNDFYPRLRYAHHLQAIGRLDEAEAIIRDLLAAFPDRLWLGWTLDGIDRTRRLATPLGRAVAALGLDRPLSWLLARRRRRALRRAIPPPAIS